MHLNLYKTIIRLGLFVTITLQMLPYFCINKKLLIMNANILLMTSNTAGSGIS